MAADTGLVRLGLQAYERTAGLPEPIITESCFSKMLNQPISGS
ncbi:hypothetical protein [Pedobacter sp. BS3]|nr:hypothetical protein [Pedobacter sp. BS3]